MSLDLLSCVEDGSIDHLFQIGALIAAAQEMKAKEGYRWDMWEVTFSTEADQTCPCVAQ